jgi:delta-aminolevulinic acid dehydratase/porphobilinogen synthase
MMRETLAPPPIVALFAQASQKLAAAISSMPGQTRLMVDGLLDDAGEAARLSVRSVVLSPALEDAVRLSTRTPWTGLTVCRSTVVSTMAKHCRCSP